MHLLAKIFLGKDKFYALGPGRAALLRATEKLGSLNKAAQSVGMSYRWAWGRLKDSEEALGIKLLSAGPSPSRGQPKILTPEGQELLDWYTEVEAKIAQVLQEMPWPEFLPGNNSFIDPEAPKQRLSLD
ncbi:MAG: LysR family transcriptional regulator [Deltaproteobacteria bacterium]|jgi:molybdate transport system regulatory protein|nr:LysR family transcriptional regulator [Deltaproteobacteria bacterium]